MKYVAVYGSLKAGAYNHSRLRDATLVATSKVKGKMYLVFNSYPLLMDVDGPEHDVEIYEVQDDVARAINSMEIGAGYYPATFNFTSLTGPQEATIYFANPDTQTDDLPYIEEYSSKTAPMAYG